VDINKIFYGIKALRREFKNEMWIEILFVKGVNDSKNEIELLKEAVREIKPDRVCINTIYRPPAFDEYLPVDNLAIKKLQLEFDSILDIASKKQCSTLATNIFSDTDELLDELANMLSIRPCTLEDIYNVFYSSDSSMTEDILEGILADLVKSKKLYTKKFANNKFYYSN
jgi:wyosine [tRNA(Phe)-imidazoG37] synthetase (radical SAM superfamily)